MLGADAIWRSTGDGYTGAKSESQGCEAQLTSAVWSSENVASDPPMVAREAELARILSVISTVMTGSGRCLMLVGEPGIGKTRLAREALRGAAALGASTSTGRCFEQHTTVPFFPFAEAFAGLLSRAPQDHMLDVSSRLPELAYILGEGSTRDLPPGQATQLQVFRAAAAFLDEQAGIMPVVLLLEDLHWADSTSLGLLLYLGRHLGNARILILGTYRDSVVGTNHPLEEVIRELVRERTVDEVPLRRLTPAGTRALIGSRLRDDGVSDDLIAKVHVRADGNPFFTEELLKAVMDQRSRRQTSGGSSTELPSDVGVPRSIRAAVNERVRRLATDVQDVLRLACIVGQEFDHEILLAASDQPGTVPGALDAALSARLIETRRDRPERYAFSHALIHETLLEEIPLHRRRQLHLRVGEALEDPRVTTTAADIAHHYLSAADAERTILYSVRAGDDAAARYAHAEAAHWYAVAAGLFTQRDDLDQAAYVRCRRGSELYDLNALADAEAEYQTALATFQRAGDTKGQAVAQWGLGRIHQARYDMAQSVRILDEAVRLWPNDPEDANLVMLLVDAARARTFSGDPAAAIALAERALQHAEQLGNGALQARALFGLACASDQELPDRDLIGMLDRAESLALAAGDWRTLCRIYTNRALSRLALGELAEQLEDHRRAVAAAERCGDTERLAFAHLALSVDLMQACKWEEGRQSAQLAIDLDPTDRPGNYLARAMLAFLQGRFDESVRQFLLLAADSRVRADVQGLVVGLSSAADVMLQLDGPLDATLAAEAAQIAREKWRPTRAACVAIEAETLVRLRAAGAERTLVQAEQLARELDMPIAQPQLLRARGLLLLSRGDITGAVEVLDASAALARGQRSTWQLGRTLAVLLEAARQSSDETLQAKTKAELRGIIEQIGPEAHGLLWARGVSRHRTRSMRASVEGPLSSREREVAALIARGLTDRQIADQLVISEGTAGVHVSHILNKLGFHRRTEIATWAHQHELAGNSTEG